MSYASATAIAQQLPGAPWVFAGELPAGSPLPWPTTERIAPVTTPMGRKNIPMQVASDAVHMSITCPFTGAEFLFSQLSGAVVGAGRAIGSGARVSHGYASAIGAAAGILGIPTTTGILGIPTTTGSTKTTYNPPGNSSSKTAYYVAGGVVVVGLAVGAWWWLK